MRLEEDTKHPKGNSKAPRIVRSIEASSVQKKWHVSFMYKRPGKYRHIHMYVYIYIYEQICLHDYRYACMHVRVHVPQSKLCLHVCM